MLFLVDMPMRFEGEVLADKIVIHINPEVLDLVPGYINNRKNDLPVIKQYLENNAFEEIRTMGHKMKGGGNLYGLEQVTLMGDKIEKAAIALDKKPIEEALAVLEDYLNRVEVV